MHDRFAAIEVHNSFVIYCIQTCAWPLLRHTYSDEQKLNKSLKQIVSLKFSDCTHVELYRVC